VVQVAAHRLVVLEPRLRNDVLAVVREHLLHLSLVGRRRGAERGPLRLELGRLLDQLLRLPLFLRVEAAELPVRLEVDPGVELVRRAVAGFVPVRRLDERRERLEARLDVRVVDGGRLPVRVLVEVGPLPRSGELGECHTEKLPAHCERSMTQGAAPKGGPLQ
jgi:hypothetical protein